MNFMEEINKETQAMLKQISIRKAEKKAVAEKRIAELKKTYQVLGARPMKTKD